VQISNHLLLHCDFALGVWYAVSIWLGLTSVNPPNLFISFASLVGFGNSKLEELKPYVDLASRFVVNLEGQE
jgi:hypothetical protein